MGAMDLLQHKPDSSHILTLHMVKTLRHKAGEVFTRLFRQKSKLLPSYSEKNNTNLTEPIEKHPVYNLSYAELVVPVFRTFQKQEEKMNAQEELIHAYLSEIKQLKETLEEKLTR